MTDMLNHTVMQRLLAAAGWDAGSLRHKQLEDALDGARLEIVDRGIPAGEPVAWMNSEHIEAYRTGKRDGIAWAAPDESDFYNVALYAAPQPLTDAQSGMDREKVAKIFAVIWHGDIGEWQGFLSKADAFLAYPGSLTSPQCGSGK